MATFAVHLMWWVGCHEIQHGQDLHPVDRVVYVPADRGRGAQPDPGVHVDGPELFIRWDVVGAGHVAIIASEADDVERVFAIRA